MIKSEKWEKIIGLTRDSNPGPLDYGASALLTELNLEQSGGAKKIEYLKQNQFLHEK